MKLSIGISSDEHGLPAYAVLSAKMNMSGMMIKKIRLYGRLLVNGRASRMKDPVYEGDIVEAMINEDQETALRPNSGITVYYEDDWVIVCEKPSDLVTHPSWQHLNDSLIQRLSEDRLHPVMRLDRETTGVIVVAKNGYAHNQIISSEMHKEYIGIVHGKVDPSSGIINLPIARSETSIMIRVVREDGKNSITHYDTLLYNDSLGISMVRFVLETGRCHQIRVHSRHLGHPLIGDGLYGPSSIDYSDEVLSGSKAEALISRQALHASLLSFVHPITHEKLSFRSILPKDMMNLISSIG